MRITLGLVLLLIVSPTTAAESPSWQLVGVSKIWDQAPHSAFTDLVRHKDRWFCTFREGAKHVSPDGAIRVLTSSDGTAWESAARLTSATADLRDPKLCVTPGGQLMLLAAGAWHKPKGPRHQSLVWFSDDGRSWGEPIPVGDPGYWLWRVVWHKGTAYGIGYETGSERDTRLYRSHDGRKFEAIISPLLTVGRPSETAFAFLPDDTSVCLVRRDGVPTAIVGTSKPPYISWEWKDLDRSIGGPQLLRLPDGRLVVAGRMKDGNKVHTAIGLLKPAAGKLDERLKLPSGGDTSYPGLVWHEGQLWVSYYSSHEGKSSIYLAKIKVAE